MRFVKVGDFPPLETQNLIFILGLLYTLSGSQGICQRCTVLHKACEAEQEGKRWHQDWRQTTATQDKISRCHKYKIKCSGFQEKARVGRERGSGDRGTEKSLGWENQRGPRGGQEPLPEWYWPSQETSCGSSTTFLTSASVCGLHSSSAAGWLLTG